jgi:CRP-like cAMP-binding protein
MSHQWVDLYAILGTLLGCSNSNELIAALRRQETWDAITREAISRSNEIDEELHPHHVNTNESRLHATVSALNKTFAFEDAPAQVVTCPEINAVARAPIPIHPFGNGEEEECNSEITATKSVSIGERLKVAIEREDSSRKYVSVESRPDETYAVTLAETREQLKRANERRRLRFIMHLYLNVSWLTIIANTILISIRVGLGSDVLPTNLVYFELTADIIIFLGQSANLLIPFEDKGLDIVALDKIRSHYFSSYRCYIDVVTTFPGLIIAVAIGFPQFEYARVNVALRALLLHDVLDDVRKELKVNFHPSFWRLFLYTLDILIVVTFTGTALMLYTRLHSSASVYAWFEQDMRALPGDPLTTYLMLWRLQLTCITDRKFPFPTDDVQFAFSLVSVVIAVTVTVVLIASVEEMVVDIVEESSKKSKKIDDATEFMTYLGVPNEIIGEVSDYYCCMFSLYHTFDFRQNHELLSDLPKELRQKLIFESNSRIFRSIPMFASLADHPDLITQITTELQEVVIMPGAHITTRGEEGDCMFFLFSGDAIVMSPQSDEVPINTMHSGSYFGEIALLFGGTRRNTIIAKTVCIVYVLTSAQFELLIDSYPRVLQEIMARATALEMQYQEQEA